MIGYLWQMTISFYLSHLNRKNLTFGIFVIDFLLPSHQFEDTNAASDIISTDLTDFMKNLKLDNNLLFL